MRLCLRLVFCLASMRLPSICVQPENHGHRKGFKKDPSRDPRPKLGARNLAGYLKAPRPRGWVVPGCFASGAGLGQGVKE